MTKTQIAIFIVVHLREHFQYFNQLGKEDYGESLIKPDNAVDESFYEAIKKNVCPAL